MAYIDSQRILRETESFLRSLNRYEHVASARSFFESKMGDVGRAFERGEMQQEDLAKKISDLLKSFAIYLEPYELRDLEKRFKQL